MKRTALTSIELIYLQFLFIILMIEKWLFILTQNSVKSLIINIPILFPNNI